MVRINLEYKYFDKAAKNVYLEMDRGTGDEKWTHTTIRDHVLNNKPVDTYDVIGIDVDNKRLNKDDYGKSLKEFGADKPGLGDDTHIRVYQVKRDVGRTHYAPSHVQDAIADAKSAEETGALSADRLLEQKMTERRATIMGRRGGGRKTRKTRKTRRRRR